MRFDLELNLPDALITELKHEAQRREIPVHTCAAEIVEAGLAGIRLPHVEAGRQGAQMCGTRGHSGPRRKHEDEEEEPEVVGACPEMPTA